MGRVIRIFDHKTKKYDRHEKEAALYKGEKSKYWYYERPEGDYLEVKAAQDKETIILNGAHSPEINRTIKVLMSILFAQFDWEESACPLTEEGKDFLFAQWE